MSETIKFNICPKCQAPIPAEAPQGLCPKCVLGGAASPTEAGVSATATGEIPAIARIAAAFPQLEILELIGRGGMGFVFKVRQPHLDRHVALKLLPDKLASDPHFAERFNREGRVLARLSHPNIVSIFDFGQAGGFYYLLMEYVDGVNLRQAMRAGRFSPAEALAVVPKICEALQYAHEQGVLHRDIKPENILLDAKGRVKIADFGIAKLVGEDAPSVTLTGTGHALGTPHYMAPEQLEKPGEVDHRADIYSLGVVFYEMLTGELPLGRFAPPSARTPLDRRVDEIVMRALEKERDLRQKNVSELKTQVERVKSEPPLIGDQPELSNPAPPLGPGGTIATGNLARQQQAGSRFSAKAICGAALVGISLLLPLLSLVAALLWRHKFESPANAPRLALNFFSVFALSSIPALVGTILGWIALSDIGASGGKLRGAALAMFTALTWPGLALAGLTIWLVVAPVRNLGATSPFAGFLLLLVPVGILTFLIWAIYATTRRVTGERTAERRGVLKWIFAGLLVSAIGFVSVSSFRARRSAAISEEGNVSPPTAVESATTAPRTKIIMLIRPMADERGASVNITTETPLGRGESIVPVIKYPDGRRADSLVNSYTIRQQGRTTTSTTFSFLFGGIVNAEHARTVVSDLAATFAGKTIELVAGQPRQLFFVKNTSDEMLECYLDYRFDAEKANSTPPPAVIGITSVSSFPGSLVLDFTPSLGSEYLIQGLGLGPVGVEEDTRTTTALSDSFRKFDCTWHLPASFSFDDAREAERQVRLVKEEGAMTLNPGEKRLLFAITNQSRETFQGYLEFVNALPAPPSAASAAWIGFTFTSVELREDAGARWLAIDYLDDVHGEVEKSFPWDAKIPGFKPETRTSEFVGGDKNAVRHQRVEFRMPDSVPRDQLEKFRDHVALALKQKSFRLEAGEAKSLFELATPEGGSLTARLKVVPPLKVVPDSRASAGTAEGPGSPRKLELRIPAITDDPYRSVGVTTDSELPVGDYLVGLLQRPDGRIEEHPAVATIYAGSGRARVMRHILWSMSLFESNRVREILADMRGAVDGHVIALKPDERLPIFQATNDHGGFTAGFIALRSRNLTATNLPPVTVSIVQVPQHWPQFLSVKLRISAPHGYLPNAVGLLGDGSQLETSTSIMGGGRAGAWSGDACLWYFPQEFQANDVQEIVRQLDSTKTTSPNGVIIPPGQRVPMFSVTNKTGTIFRGYFELPMAIATK